MREKCPTCGEQELVRQPTDVFRLGLPWLNSLVQIETPYVCPSCGKEVRRQLQNTHNFSKASLRRSGKSDSVEPTSFQWYGIPALSMHGVVRLQDRVFIPTSEGRIQDGSVVDQFGDPDLMAEMAREYLRQFWTLLPRGRFPNNLKEAMPALLLLVTSAEQALKSFGIRSEQPAHGHPLTDLYNDLNSEYKIETERLFRKSEIVAALLENGQEAPTIEHILSIYSNTYGQRDGVYVDVRYFAEPTTMLPQSSNLHGANLVKSLTPYPVFLPAVVEALLEAYRITSGVERLRRRGADIQGNIRDEGTGSHGDWGVVPASLGLVVVAAPQSVALDSAGQETEVFADFTASHPTGLQVSWMHGGSRLLFYRDDEGRWRDEDVVVDGLGCRLWYHGRLGMHARDLNQLADVLEDTDREAWELEPLVELHQSTSD